MTDNDDATLLLNKTSNASKPSQCGAPRNRTLRCSEEEVTKYRSRLLSLSKPQSLESLTNQVVCQDFFDAIRFLPSEFVDLLIIDPPYNLTKDYHGKTFCSLDAEKYQDWFVRLIESIQPTLKSNASVYICSDWKTSTQIYPILERFFHVLNRITWEREKGRGAKSNWKNNTEDIWFCTQGTDYYFDVNAVKLKRRVLAPYRTESGAPKDWTVSKNGCFRLTHPSNIWTDISIPFWSMSENTDHPTQKPEKLIAKLILASSKPGAFVFDPFGGSATTAVTAKKLGRKFLTIEQNELYCCWGLKRLEQAEQDPKIQGYSDGVFWERNSGPN